MKLYEFEGHRILAKVGIESPFFVACSNLDEVKQARKRLKFPMVAKVQVLSGRRGKSGGVKFLSNEKQLLTFAKEMFGNKFNGEDVRFISFSKKIEIEKELYLSIAYDTIKKNPFFLFCEEGGVDIEEVKKRSPEKIVRVDIDSLTGPTKKNLEALFRHELVDFATRLWDAFWRFDCRMVEINPLALVRESGSHPRIEVKTKSGVHLGDGHSYVAIDAKIILDDAGLARHRDLDVLPKGAASAVPTERELAARKVDEGDWRGTAGSIFIELDGDIAVLASGGGASLLTMDALTSAGGKGANYTEYSGNPPAEKVEKLTKITLDRENLSGCLVCGAVANFTDIYETLKGFTEGLRQVRPKPSYPIVIRRGGPGQEKIYEAIGKIAQKEDYDIHLFGPETPISVACQKMVELSNDYKIRNPKYESKIDSYD